MPKQNTFEKTYKHYAFAPLVTLGIKIAAWIVGSPHPTKRAMTVPQAASSDRRLDAV